MTCKWVETFCVNICVNWRSSAALQILIRIIIMLYLLSYNVGNCKMSTRNQNCRFNFFMLSSVVTVHMRFLRKVENKINLGEWRYLPFCFWGSWYGNNFYQCIAFTYSKYLSLFNIDLRHNPMGLLQNLLDNVFWNLWVKK